VSDLRAEINRGERRRRLQKAIRRAFRVIHDVWQLHKHPGFRYENGKRIETPVDERTMARRMAETHCRPCSCHLCRYHKDVPPKRERGDYA
jgi:hypothetical protein